MSSINRVSITKSAVKIAEKLKAKYGELIFHQSGGCCDGSAPMIFKKEDMFINETDILVGVICGINFYMNKDQFEYWKHTHLTIDIVKGRGSSFSLEIPLGLRFIVHSRLFTEEESATLNP